MKAYKTIQMDSSGTHEVDHFCYDFREIENVADFNIYDTDVSVDLDPCPFCGVNGSINRDNRGYFGWCSICGAEGPRHHNWHHAANMWNARNDLRTIAISKGFCDGDYTDFRNMDFDRFTDETRNFMIEKCLKKGDNT